MRHDINLNIFYQFIMELTNSQPFINLLYNMLVVHIIWKALINNYRDDIIYNEKKITFFKKYLYRVIYRNLVDTNKRSCDKIVVNSIHFLIFLYVVLHDIRVILISVQNSDNHKRECLIFQIFIRHHSYVMAVLLRYILLS